ncbi:TrkH family potassium uptake protein [Aerococcus sp. 1KP-2016]|uniref:TrkH family potassium uptake protein n=1 Tax=Aerococcus sp. 1KP-2016 TaxID=1981982 RepID=UPI000B99A7FA|nr:potassium transporter TrkG [Aerococcus sp. 1KP-2016]OYQ67987.1 potassium transporter [Aerococcus sp. 1KP-2016]
MLSYVANPVSQLSSAKIIALSFALVIFVGSLLLNLPISQVATSDATYFDHLFIAVSAVCVTGLWVESIYDTYNLFGQIIMMILIQIGGLGLMTFISVIYFKVGHNVRLSAQVAVTGALNSSSLDNISNWLGKIFKYTFIIEGIGALLFSTFFIPELGFAKGAFISIFMAVSAFCNAGFDPLGNVSMIGYQTVPIINWTIISLIILGGIGFSVWFDVTTQIKKFDWSRPKIAFKAAIRKLRPHTKLAIGMTILIIIIGTILFLAFEWQNEGTIGNMTIGNKIMTAVFQTVTMRTAGFATIDYTLTHPISNLIFIVTMFIGGSPGGTAGGLKTTTFALVIMLAISEIRQKDHVNFVKHSIPAQLLRQAFVIFLLYIALLIIGSGLILIFDPHVDYLYILFESISAFATVGVTANLTPTLTMASQIVIMALMFIGRIGPMTMFLSLLPNKKDKTHDIQYTTTNILIG